jgi:hypothetical protein
MGDFSMKKLISLITIIGLSLANSVFPSDLSDKIAQEQRQCKIGLLELEEFLSRSEIMKNQEDLFLSMLSKSMSEMVTVASKAVANSQKDEDPTWLKKLELLTKSMRSIMDFAGVAFTAGTYLYVLSKNRVKIFEDPLKVVQKGFEAFE